MKTKGTPYNPAIDQDLYAVLKETFGNDERLLNEAIVEAQRALSAVREDYEWREIAETGNCEIF